MTGIRFRRLGASPPPYNLKATAVACPGTKYIFLYGGLDEYETLDSTVYLLNMETHTWETDTAVPSLYREGHSAVHLGDGNILVFGGVPEPADNHETFGSTTNSSPMMVYSVKSRRWSFADARFLVGAPVARSRHACCLSEDRKTVYISGGLVDSTPLSDLYCYNMETAQWSGPAQFVAHFDHSVFVHGGKLYASGGLDADMNHVCAKLRYLNLDTRSLVAVDMGISPPAGPPESEAEVPETGLASDQGFRYDHVWLDSGDSTIKLEVALPSWGKPRGSAVRASRVDLRSFARSDLFLFRDVCAYAQEKLDLDVASLSLKHCFVYHGELHFLAEDSQLDGLSCLLSVGLGDLGVAPETAPSSVAHDLQALFVAGTHSDYRSVALKEASEVSVLTLADTNDDNTRSLAVHRSILIARWPHFQRMIDTGMDEAVSGTLFIPEAYNSVWIMVFYIYTGTIDVERDEFSVADYSRVLILANLYELADLRLLILAATHKSLTEISAELALSPRPDLFSTLVDVWTICYISNEEMFISKIHAILRKHWHAFTHSTAFSALSKDTIVNLRRSCSKKRNPSKRQKKSVSESATSSPEQRLPHDMDSPFIRSFPAFPSSPYAPEDGFPK